MLPTNKRKKMEEVTKPKKNPRIPQLVFVNSFLPVSGSCTSTTDPTVSSSVSTVPVFIKKGYNGSVVCFSDVARVDRCKVGEGFYSLEMKSISGDTLLNISSVPESIIERIVYTWTRARSCNECHFLSYEPGTQQLFTIFTYVAPDKQKEIRE